MGMIRLLIAAAFVALVVAVPHSKIGVSNGGSCKTQMDCQLNGECNVSTGECVCDQGWTGPQCSSLKLGLSTQIWPLEEYPTSPSSSASSWGASLLTDADGTRHLFANVVCQASTCAHTLNAQIIHATSKLTGDAKKNEYSPMEYSDVAIPPSVENIHAIRTQKGEYLLYYHDHGFRVPMSNCTGSFPSPHPQTFSPPPVSTEGMGIAVASSVFGPWSYIRPSFINVPSGDIVGWGANPSATVLKNGTIFLAIRYNMGDERLAVATADSYEGPYTILNPHISPLSLEDPHVYTNARGYHIVYHQYNGTVGGFNCAYTTGGCDLTGGHAYSQDGINWMSSEYPTYTTRVSYENGTVADYRYRERPELVVDENGVPSHLLTGVEWGGKDKPPCRSVSVLTKVEA